jgi:hypothetical protein
MVYGRNVVTLLTHESSLRGAGVCALKKMVEVYEKFGNFF